MILLIAGGRDFIPQSHHWQWLNDFHRHQAFKHDLITEVVSGKQRGADKFGEDWADDRGISAKPFKANWKLLGKAAGPVRNNMMAQYLCDKWLQGESVAVILFPGGRGTQNMYDQAHSREITIYDWRERTE